MTWVMSAQSLQLQLSICPSVSTSLLLTKPAGASWQVHNSQCPISRQAMLIQIRRHQCTTLSYWNGVNGAGDQTPHRPVKGQIKTGGPAWEIGEGRGWVSTSTTAAAGPTKAYRSPPSRESQQLGKRQAVSTQPHAHLATSVSGSSI